MRADRVEEFVGGKLDVTSFGQKDYAPSEAAAVLFLELVEVFFYSPFYVGLGGIYCACGGPQEGAVFGGYELEVHGYGGRLMLAVVNDFTKEDGVGAVVVACQQEVVDECWFFGFD